MFLTRKTKKYRLRIKNICIPSNKLFQVPFTKEHIQRYKGISKNITFDCYFQTITVLGLRHYTVSKRDSLNVKKKGSHGVETRDAAKYLSTIFNANIVAKCIIDKETCDNYPSYKNIYVPRTKQNIITQLHSYLDLENGYATFICGLFYNNNMYGHFFIIHKQNDEIYYYDQCSKINTKNINKIRNDKFIGFFLYYNESKETCMLLKDKITTDIPIY